MIHNHFIETLFSGLEFFHLPVDKTSLSVYSRYFELLCDWNTRMNLVSERDMDRFVEYHILDSLKIVSCIDFSLISSILDFGSGAGLPGIPLAIAFPDCRITLVDSMLKRTIFLETVVSSLSLSNVHVLRSRAEDIPSSLNSSFDLVVTRATLRLSSFFLTCSRFLSPAGFLVSIKGEDILDELSSLHRSCENTVFNIHDYIPHVPDNVRSGHVICVSRC